jgi:crossover junction endodeoxyribonuclease RuvC
VIVVGIDPGLSGAIAAINTRTGGVVIEDMPTKETGAGGTVQRRIDGRALAVMLRRLAPADEVGDKGPFVVCELVHAIAGKRDGQGGMQQMGSLMRTLGAVEAVLDAMQFESTYVRPQGWRPIYGGSLKVDEPDQRKRVEAQKKAARELAMRMYPAAQDLLKRVKDHNRAEALLIAHFGRRKVTG